MADQHRPMSDDQLHHIRSRHIAATPGRWYIDPDRQPKWLIRSDHPDHGDICHVSFAEPTALIPKPSGPNLRFILNAHRDVAALLAEVERLRSRLDVPTRESVNRGEHTINQYRAHHGLAPLSETKAGEEWLT